MAKNKLIFDYLKTKITDLRLEGEHDGTFCEFVSEKKNYIQLESQFYTQERGTVLEVDFFVRKKVKTGQDYFLIQNQESDNLTNILNSINEVKLTDALQWVFLQRIRVEEVLFASSSTEILFLLKTKIIINSNY